MYEGEWVVEKEERVEVWVDMVVVEVDVDVVNWLFFCFGLACVQLQW